ncbi:hypothetical protein GGI25_002333 [Coemansia spiralis]|uniref:AB hydrolase-1 domain-containing protein n=2 Tax=Coemansia TaxID=4863 RepID=A0A9W8GB03_9FUNG|nr:Alpha/Beta hydrolase protein [Coemansia spiralis]KAJ1989563.1 hypothetical protein EDC05_004597 [Coemansia umbellata]KAJ2625721.1 hypothetical protein GGI26_000521 [Coemansia sp. RSA 1358]KAJ2678539.1 hypothetical protein GGI25_002333 [Coemansia spiralis]
MLIISRQLRNVPKQLCRHRWYSEQGSTVDLAFTKNSAPAASSGPPLVVLHGLFGSKQNWGAISRRLSQELNRDIYSVDQRNHGDSPHKAPHTYEAMARDLLNFISSHKMERPVLVGHSMGGKVAMRAALEQPDLVSLLIVDDMVPVSFGLHHDFASYIDKMKEIEVCDVTSQKLADEMLRKVEPDVSVRQFLLTNMKKSRDGVKGAYRSRIPLSLLGDSLENMMMWENVDRVYEGPTLFIAGTRSPYVQEHAYPAMKRYFPNYQLEELDTGHWVHAEKPQEFMGIVVDFIRAHQH